MLLPAPALRVLVALQVVVLMSGLTLARWSAPPDAPRAAQAAASADDRLPRWFASTAEDPQAVPVAARGDGGERGAPARAVTTTSRRSAPISPQSRGERALRSLHYDWGALGYTVRFLTGTRGTLGTTNSRTRVITVYVSRGQSELSLRTTIAHELGHALDFQHGTTQRRDDYRSIRGLSKSSAWFPCSRCNDLASPAGDFAESFAVWLVGPGDFRGRLRPAPSSSQLRQLGRVFTVPAAPRAAPRPAEPSASPTTRPRTQPGLVVVLPGGGDPSPSPR